MLSSDDEAPSSKRLKLVCSGIKICVSTDLGCRSSKTDASKRRQTSPKEKRREDPRHKRRQDRSSDYDTIVQGSDNEKDGDTETDEDGEDGTGKLGQGH